MPNDMTRERAALIIRLTLAWFDGLQFARGDDASRLSLPRLGDLEDVAQWLMAVTIPEQTP
jgi:hypothetical protein